MATIVTSATLSMITSKATKPKYAPIIETPLEPQTTLPAKVVKPVSANEGKRQIKGAESEQRAHNMMTVHACCYHDCLHEGIVHIGENGGDSHWICCLHLDHWNANRARFLSDGGGCAMQRLGELLEGED
jgi:hypothetical protein